MSIYEAGFNPRPEDEREQESWFEPDPDDWRGGEPPFQGDEWKRDWTGTPQERMHRERLDDGDGS